MARRSCLQCRRHVFAKAVSRPAFPDEHRSSLRGGKERTGCFWPWRCRCRARAERLMFWGPYTAVWVTGRVGLCRSWSTTGEQTFMFRKIQSALEPHGRPQARRPAKLPQRMYATLIPQASLILLVTQREPCATKRARLMPFSPRYRAITQPYERPLCRAWRMLHGCRCALHAQSCRKHILWCAAVQILTVITIERSGSAWLRGDRSFGSVLCTPIRLVCGEDSRGTTQER